jgi:1-acyl-sn-glycerol-3-phosphate acyltransferase
MSTIRNIFARLWAAWGLLTFVATFLLFFLPSMVSYAMPDPGGQAYFIRVSRYWMNLWLFLVGCPVKISGKENFIPGKTYVIVFNHNTFLDVPLSCPYIPGANKTIAKNTFAKIPLFGLFYRKGSVLVDRKNERSRAQSFEEMKKVLANGMHMCIYPEGTRNRTAQPLKPFYDGAFKLACDTGHDIVPGIITGTRKAMPTDRTFYFLPVRLKMQFLPPVSPAGHTVNSLKDEVFKKMLDQYVKNV